VANGKQTSEKMDNDLRFQLGGLRWWRLSWAADVISSAKFHVTFLFLAI